MSDIHIFYEATPNPQALRFIVTKTIADESVNMVSAAEAGRSPLAQKILGFPWAAGVLIGPNFVTVSKQDWVDWDAIADPLSDLIKEHLKRGEPVLLRSESGAAEGGGGSAGDGNQDQSDDSLIVQKIKKILRDEIRPAVAMDGGDIEFDCFVEGRVYLHMRGACSGCPSSAFTLKEGIETRLKESVPEVQEVVQVM